MCGLGRVEGPDASSRNRTTPFAADGERPDPRTRRFRRRGRRAHDCLRIAQNSGADRARYLEFRVARVMRLPGASRTGELSSIDRGCGRGFGAWVGARGSGRGFEVRPSRPFNGGARCVVLAFQGFRNTRRALGPDRGRDPRKLGRAALRFDQHLTKTQRALPARRSRWPFGGTDRATATTASRRDPAFNERTRVARNGGRAQPNVCSVS
jgi:hypothetical protein